MITYMCHPDKLLFSGLNQKLLILSECGGKKIVEAKYKNSEALTATIPNSVGFNYVSTQG